MIAASDWPRWAAIQCARLRSRQPFALGALFETGNEAQPAGSPRTPGLIALPRLALSDATDPPLPVGPKSTREGRLPP